MEKVIDSKNKPLCKKSVKSFYLSEDIYLKAKELARQDKRSISSLIAVLIENAANEVMRK